MRFLFPAAAVLVVVSVCASTASGQDPDIDRLLKKLPPPEKLVKTEIAPGIHRNDPIFQDPLGQEIQKAVTAGNYTRALAAARKLTERYPNSVVAQISRGSYALMSQQIGEASTAFRKATVLQPRLAMAHFGLGLAEGAQGRFSAAWPHLQKATQLEPGAVPAWIYLSACAERLGRKQESVRAARRATQLAPKSGPAWGQLARAEHASGNRTEALLAAGKAARFSPDLVTVTAAASVGALDIRRPVEGSEFCDARSSWSRKIVSCASNCSGSNLLPHKPAKPSRVSKNALPKTPTLQRRGWSLAPLINSSSATTKPATHSAEPSA
jgi:tetratricopeptide (TPR) repeat protein